MWHLSTYTAWYNAQTCQSWRMPATLGLTCRSHLSRYGFALPKAANSCLTAQVGAQRLVDLGLGVLHNGTGVVQRRVRAACSGHLQGRASAGDSGCTGAQKA